METPPSGPLSLPAGSALASASGRGVTLECPIALPERSIVGFELLLGARPVPALARVVAFRPKGAFFLVELDFVAMAQVDRDALVDFLQAVGDSALRIRRASEA